MTSVNKNRCLPCEGISAILSSDTVNKMLSKIQGWNLDENKGTYIYRIFQFDNFAQNMAFINVVAWIAEKEGHHPNIEVEFTFCKVKFWTHSIGGLSENDFICAEKINAIF